MTPDQRRRLVNLRHDAATLLLELRTDRASAEGPTKTTLRAVGVKLEGAYQRLNAACERAGA